MNDLEKAKILFTALFKGKSDSSPNYKIYEKAFLNNILSSEEIKLEIMKGNNEACYILAKTYEIINRNPQNFIQNYIGRTDITFDDAILSAAYFDTLNTPILGDPNYNNIYKHS